MDNTTQWIWQQKKWPQFTWQIEIIAPLLRKVRLHQGMLLGKVGAIDSQITQESILDTLLDNIIASTAIEGEQLNLASVRSSLAKRMGIHLQQISPTTKRSEGLAQMMMDVITNLDNPLSLERLLEWHQWLFVENTNSLYPINAGQLRGEEVMQVVSGRIDKPTVHFEAPPRAGLEKQLSEFITWFNDSVKDPSFDPLLRAAICHFWFVTLHPFDDGNGRITRALTDLALAQDNQQSIRFYAMSSAILANRKEYYRVLEQSQRNTTNITVWLRWFLEILTHSIERAINKIDLTLIKSRFWQRYQAVELTKDQVKILNCMLDADEGLAEGISATQYKKITKVSKATATRHLTDLLDKGCIEKLPGGGRSTRYQIKMLHSSLNLHANLTFHQEFTLV